MCIYENSQSPEKSTCIRTAVYSTLIWNVGAQVTGRCSPSHPLSSPLTLENAWARWTQDGPFPTAFLIFIIVMKMAFGTQSQHPPSWQNSFISILSGKVSLTICLVLTAWGYNKFLQENAPINTVLASWHESKWRLEEANWENVKRVSLTLARNPPACGLRMLCDSLVTSFFKEQCLFPVSAPHSIFFMPIPPVISPFSEIPSHLYYHS